MTGSNRRGALVAAGSASLCALVATAPLPAAAGDPASGAIVVFAVVSLFRAAAVALTAYVAVTAGAFVACSVTGRPRAGVARAMPVALRRALLGSSVALAMTAAPLVSNAAGAAPERRPPTMVVVERPPSTGLDPRAGQPPDAGPARPVAPEPTPPAPAAAGSAGAAPIGPTVPDTAPTVPPHPAPRTPAPTGPASSPVNTPPRTGSDTPGRPEPAPPQGAATWLVRSGDHFWSIAQAVLEQELGRAATEAEVRVRWLALIELNAGQLVEPGNPDLLLPGQNLRLFAP